MLLNFEKEVIARAERLAAAHTDFERRACAGQLYPETAHTMTQLDLFATLQGISTVTMTELVAIIKAQDQRITELQAEAVSR